MRTLGLLLILALTSCIGTGCAAASGNGPNIAWKLLVSACRIVDSWEAP